MEGADRWRDQKNNEAEMAEQHAIAAARDELAARGVKSAVVGIYRPGQRREVVVLLEDGTEYRVQGRLAIKLSTMLRSNYQRWRNYAPKPRSRR